LAVADRSAVEQVLWILLDNAVTYAPAGPVRVTIETRAAEAQGGATTGTEVVVRVADEGPGVARPLTGPGSSADSSVARAPAGEREPGWALTSREVSFGRWADECGSSLATGSVRRSPSPSPRSSRADPSDPTSSTVARRRTATRDLAACLNAHHLRSARSPAYRLPSRVICPVRATWRTAAVISRVVQGCGRAVLRAPRRAPVRPKTSGERHVRRRRGSSHCGTGRPVRSRWAWSPSRPTRRFAP
jgi:hypothetical protein